MRVCAFPTFVLRLASRCLAIQLSLLLIVVPVAGQPSGGAAAVPAESHSTAAQATAKRTVKKPAKAGKKKKKPSSRESKAARRARTARIKLAFQASTELRPMAQQLATLRTPAAYAGVTSYAHKHTGEAAAAAYLALGHAYMLDKSYAEAAASLRLARQTGVELADYDDFLGARANHEAGNEKAAEALMHGFAERHPDSIFVDQAPELEANILLAMRDAAGAEKALVAAAGTEAANRPGYQLAQGEPLQDAAAGPSAEFRGRDCARQADADGRGDKLDHGGVAQPCRCLLERRPLRGRERAIPRAGPAVWSGCREPLEL
jgi:soluble lytic murein transglycosylase